MFTFADTAQGSWALAEALMRCDRARDRIEGVIASLRTIEAECPWRARAIDLLRGELARQAQELQRILDELGAVESALRAG
ncbi:hypothetical protein [Microbacterium capsulatum]|uniref:Uncharacterized protein n=1 Tax=Microbacterium capsulatum TaxID=3041921 RepID=A0ABU0XIC2_9MICO|nr:hypothetical protein [Microbacterium sp. ASV81]MDQ4214888.1 hypothetical protein [Microbacterium sp. ASV81]